MNQKQTVRVCVLQLLFAYITLQIAFADPVISEVRAQQRFGTGLVDIYFDLTGTGQFATVTVEASSDSGATYEVDISSTFGDVGVAVPLGRDRLIVWDAFADLPEVNSASFRVKVTAVEWKEVVPTVEIPAGSFQMGDSFAEGNSDELPVHTVNLLAYMLGETEVTLEQWREVRDWGLARGYYSFTSGYGRGSDHPVSSVSWDDIVRWCNAASEMVGLEPVYLLSENGEPYRSGYVTPFIDYSKNGYRLPTEAEWENAARGGFQGRRFSMGNTISHSDANYYSVSSLSYDTNEISGWHPNYNSDTSPVKSFPANAYGLYDMTGNLWEYCADWYSDNYYENSPASNPTGPEAGSERVFRGGYYGPGTRSCRVACRDATVTRGRWGSVGFRLSRNLPVNAGSVDQGSDPSAPESANFQLNTVTWNLAGTSNNGKVSGLGSYFDNTIATLTAVPDPGFVFEKWDASLLNTLPYVPLGTTSIVSVVNYGWDKYFTFEGIESYVPARRYLMGIGSYTLTGIPYETPIAIVNGGKESAITYSVDKTTPINIYVNGGSSVAPYYNFYDEQGNDLKDLFQKGYSLMRDRTYRFIADGINSKYPFMINSSRYLSQEAWVTGGPIIGTGDVIEVKVPDTYVLPLQYFCPGQPLINGFFNLSLVSAQGEIYDAYWGTVLVTVSADFNSVDVQSNNITVLGGNGLLVYNNGSFITVDTNPISILVDEDKTVSASFVVDTSDDDGDGLTAYEEEVQYGTNPQLFDTDGDSHNDYLELINYGSDPLDATSVPAYLLNVETSISTTVTGQITLGKIYIMPDTQKGSRQHNLPIEINTLAEVSVQTSNEFVFVGWAGDLLGNVNPKSIRVDSGKRIAAEIISSSNYNRIEQSALALGLEQGYSSGFLDGIAQGIEQGEVRVLADPSSYNLLTPETVELGIRLGGIRIEDTNGKKLVSFNVESSSDLISWSLEDTIEWSIVTSDTKPLFIRVSVPD